ncbi:hypothetical protein RB608_19070 [Nocardioides sp. LHD-245]|uniref:hypothetical protein n=1 Tax=Nocardioides sp. LHD-245 TaxID=3051387 RepID=UPI0027E15E61|nr:hypothetical protein [Nocardioides sp. LHD-245]
MTPLSVPAPDPRPADLGDGLEVLLLECLQCGRRTRHIKGRATYGVRNDLLVQWWHCTVCTEGETIA